MTTKDQLGFRALSDETRRNILFMLHKRDMTIVEVCENFEITRAAVKKHLSILHQGDLITVRTEGRTKVNALNPNGLRRLFDWFSYFDAFWDERLSTLKTEIEKDVQ